MRAAFSTLGPKQIYLIDIPRTILKDNNFADMFHIIEMLKNGCLSSTMYSTNLQERIGNCDGERYLSPA